MSSSKNTIKEVAKKAGVSIATVSRYVNNPTSVKKRNQESVSKAIKELNYHPDIFARRLAGGKLNTFALIIPGYEGIFYSFYAMEIIRSVAVSLDKTGHDLHLHIFWGEDKFRSSLVDGVIFADVIGNKSQLQRLIKADVPIVVLNKKFENLNVNSVSVDNFGGGFKAAEFLIHHGHKRIAHLAGDLRVQCAQDRLAGFRNALDKNNIKVREEYIKTTNFSRREAREQLEDLFKLKESPTAIFCCSDEVAVEVLSYCEENNIEVPKQLSVIGFDDNPHCLYGKLMLTTVKQPLAQMVSKGVEILQDSVKKKTVSQKIVLDTEIVIRDTVTFL